MRLMGCGHVGMEREDAEASAHFQDGVFYCSDVCMTLDAELFGELCEGEAVFAHLPLFDLPVLDDDAGFADEKGSQAYALHAAPGDQKLADQKHNDGDNPIEQAVTLRVCDRRDGDF